MGDMRPELFEEVKLYRNAREREKYDNMSDLFSVSRHDDYIFLFSLMTPIEISSVDHKLSSESGEGTHLGLHHTTGVYGRLFQVPCPIQSRLQTGAKR